MHEHSQSETRLKPRVVQLHFVVSQLLAPDVVVRCPGERKDPLLVAIDVEVDRLVRLIEPAVPDGANSEAGLKFFWLAQKVLWGRRRSSKRLGDFGKWVVPS
jgi:hypothetical protein